ncbi:SufD family Fe-S cluster assembly protein [Paracoccus sp. (in: a-proteobacteria)]|uniref:SufB/SufD family protein n=1 Tax=Paracoccus sp. TaxID=267 RepID=UPI0028A235CF|nr:SufD family Fe-S cluster assembly protein [Paracoccus sp. (in: a-proteobacteria)]
MTELAVRASAQAVHASASQSGEALSLRLAALDLPKGGFSAGARQDANARLAAMGLPGPRDEYWRYTAPAVFNAPQAAAVEIPDDAQDSPLFDGIERLKLVFVDGHFDAASSDDLSEAGIEISTLAAAEADGAHWAKAYYGMQEAAGQKPVLRPFAALNTLAATDGVLIRVTGKVARPVHLIYRRQAAAADVHLHHVVRMEPDSEVTLLETGLIGARSNVVIEADIADGARLHHLMAKRAAEPKVGISYLFARVAANALLKSFELSVSGRVMRHESIVDIIGDDAVAHVAAAALGDGTQGPFHHDNTVYITHAAERCESRQVYKKVLKNGAVGVFQGKILVKQGAQKTDGYQISQALLLDEDSQFLAKPELEIYADDVKCSHGSTTGALDETALFYLRSRGVPKERAIVLLVLSFLADALEEVEDEVLRERVLERLEDWLTERAQATSA